MLKNKFFLFKSFEFIFNLKVPNLLNGDCDGDYVGGETGF